MIETPVFKRLWLGRQGVFGHTTSDYSKRREDALRDWLLARLEEKSYWPEPNLSSCARLADRAREDADFLEVAELYAGQPDFDVTALVENLVTAESVPFLAAYRYKPSGLRKREQWERTWDLQRQEDAIDALVTLPAGDPRRLTEAQAEARKRQEIGQIPVPPKYANTDFLSTTYWKHRGKLDVPKERFFSLPFAAREADPTLVVGWAGFNHLERAKAIATFYLEKKEQEGWGADRLTPLLAGLLELVPWLMQWHNQIDPDYLVGMGDYFAEFALEEAQGLGLTKDDLEAWRPAARGRGRKKGKS